MNQKSTLQKQYDAALDRLDAAIQNRLRMLKESAAAAREPPERAEIPVFLWIMLAMMMLAFALIMIYELFVLFAHGCIPPLCPPSS